MEKNMKEKAGSFNCRKGNHLLIPYVADNSTAQQEALINLFKRIKDEGLDEIVFHEHPDMSLLEFMNFFSGPRCLMQVLAIVSNEDEEKIVDLCGMAWLGDYADCCNGVLTKAIGNFLFFKQYQKPAYTDPFRDLVFEYWFNVLNLQTLVGMTASLNRVASIYVKRLGMKELVRIPEYTTFQGKKCDGIISWLSRDEYNTSKGS